MTGAQEYMADGSAQQQRSMGAPASGPGPNAVGAELCALQEDVRNLMLTVRETCEMMKKQISKSDDVMDRMELTIKKIEEAISIANSNTDVLTRSLNRLAKALDAQRA